MGKMDNKVALVTGSGRGIGRAVALKLASEGAKIIANDLDEAPVNEVVAEIRARGGEAVACAGSVTEDDFAERFVNTAIDTYGGLDIIVNNAGYTMDSLIGNMTNESFDALYYVHLRAPFQILRAASNFIINSAKKEAEEGREVFRKVVNISSVAGTGGNVGQVNYSSMKAGIIGLTKSLSKEWGRFKVNVNCVAFGFIETRLTQATETKRSIKVEGGKEAAVGLPLKVIENFTKQIPMGRAGTAEEAAGAIYLMCCPESNYISGQTLICGGGFTM